jgi:hypothetical protein
LVDHVFYRHLRRRPIELSRFLDLLVALPNRALPGIIAEIPVGWHNERVAEIEEHIRMVSRHADEFGEEIRRRLA